MNFINLTPHSVGIQSFDPEVPALEFPSQGALRLVQSPIVLDGMKDGAFHMSSSEGTPVKVVGAAKFIGIDSQGTAYEKLCAADPKNDVIIVSMPVGNYLIENEVPNVPKGLKIAGPNTGTGPDGAIRDEGGNIIGTRTLVMYGTTQ